MKANKILCILSTIILGTSVLAGCTDNASSSTTAVAKEETTAVTISVSTSKDEMSVKLEKLGVSEELAKKFIEKANGEYTSGDVIDLSGLEIKADEKDGLAQLIRAVFDLVSTYDDSTMKISIEKSIKTTLSVSDGAIKIAREYED